MLVIVNMEDKFMERKGFFFFTTHNLRNNDKERLGFLVGHGHALFQSMNIYTVFEIYVKGL